jgi:hypothetical protein
VVKAVVSCPPCCPAVELFQMGSLASGQHPLHCLAASTHDELSGIPNSREETTELSDQSTGSPETASGVEEGGDLSGSSAVSGGETEEETVTKKRYQSDASIPTLPRTHSSFKSAGLMMGYLGFKEPPAYILLKISSERVSWLKG